MEAYADSGLSIYDLPPSVVDDITFGVAQFRLEHGIKEADWQIKVSALRNGTAIEVTVVRPFRPNAADHNSFEVTNEVGDKLRDWLSNLLVSGRISAFDYLLKIP